MHRILAVTMALLLCSCESEPEKAEARYNMVKIEGDLGSICKAAHDVEDAYYKANIADKWKWWHLVASGDCLHAELTGNYVYEHGNSAE